MAAAKKSDESKGEKSASTRLWVNCSLRPAGIPNYGEYEKVTPELKKRLAKPGEIDKIVITRPHVAVGKDLGYFLCNLYTTCVNGYRQYHIGFLSLLLNVKSYEAGLTDFVLNGLNMSLLYW